MIVGFKLGWRRAGGAELGDDGLQAIQRTVAEVRDEALCAGQLLGHCVEISGVRRIDPASVRQELVGGKLVWAHDESKGNLEPLRTVVLYHLRRPVS